MRHVWLLDVLTDLRGFAHHEGYDRLARQIDDALEVATTEISRNETAGTVAPADLLSRRPPPQRPN